MKTKNINLPLYLLSQVELRSIINRMSKEIERLTKQNESDCRAFEESANRHDAFHVETCERMKRESDEKTAALQGGFDRMSREIQSLDGVIEKMEIHADTLDEKIVNLHRTIDAMTAENRSLSLENEALRPAGSFDGANF